MTVEVGGAASPGAGRARAPSSASARSSSCSSLRSAARPGDRPARTPASAGAVASSSASPPTLPAGSPGDSSTSPLPPARYAPLIGAARPLSGDDVASVTGLAHAIDVADLDRRRLDVAERLDELSHATPGMQLLADRFADLVALDPGGVVAALASGEGVEARVGELVRRAADAAEHCAVPLPAAWDTLTPAAQAEHLTARIRTALGVPVPVLAHSTFAHQSELADSLAASGGRLGAQVTPMTWLLEVGRVHEGAGRCAEALDLAEVVNPSAPVTFQVAQLPTSRASRGSPSRGRPRPAGGSTWSPSPMRRRRSPPARCRG